MMTEVIRPNEISPPRNDLYKIMSIQNKTVIIVNHWTGWVSTNLTCKNLELNKYKKG